MLKIDKLIKRVNDINCGRGEFAAQTQPDAMKKIHEATWELFCYVSRKRGDGRLWMETNKNEGRLS